jgi:membrane-associated protease RseP (regulator of RpoE activity)
MGAITMIVGVVLMIIIHEGGHFIAAKSFGMKATNAFFGFGPKLWSTTRGETEYGVKAIPFGGSVWIIGMNPFEEVAPEDEGRTYREAPYWKKTVVVLAGIFSHFVVAILLLWMVGTVWGTIARDADGLAVRTTTVLAVSEYVPDTTELSPAFTSGVLDQDTIVSTDGAVVETWDDFTEFTRANGGNEVVIGVERDGQILDLPSTLAIAERPVIVDGGIVEDANGDPVLETVGFYGVTPEAMREHPGPILMVPTAFQQFGEAAVASVRGLWEMVLGFPKIIGSLFGGDDEILETVRPVSPIGLVRAAGPVQTSLQLLAFVNIFVGILNFIPLYPLDGGHFAVATYEKVTGREPNVQRLLPVAAVVLMFLVSLGLIGVYLDIFKPIQ